MRRGACLLEDSLLRRMVIGNSEGDELFYVQLVLSVRLQQDRAAVRKLQQLENVAFRTPATRRDIGGAVAVETLQSESDVLLVGIRNRLIGCECCDTVTIDRKRQTVWQVDASYASVVALMDHLRCQGIQRLVLESTSDYWRIWVRHEAHCCIARLAGGNWRRCFRI